MLESVPPTPASNVTPLLTKEDVVGTPADILKRIAGRRLPSLSRREFGVVVGAWKERGSLIILLAFPTAENPQDFAEEHARSYLIPE